MFTKVQKCPFAYRVNIVAYNNDKTENYNAKEKKIICFVKSIVKVHFFLESGKYYFSQA